VTIKPLLTVFILLFLSACSAYPGNKITDIPEEKTDYNVEYSFEVSTLIDYGIINKGLIESESISRAECLSAVMRVIGVTDDFVESHWKIAFEVPPLNDADFGTRETKWYINVGTLEGIAFGKEFNYENRPRYFKPQDNALISDCVNFIINCVSDTTNRLNEAEKIGLILKEDAFYKNLDENLTSETLCVLLYRMMNMKRHLYFAEGLYFTNDHFGMKVDSSGIETYKDFLDEIST